MGNARPKNAHAGAASPADVAVIRRALAERIVADESAPPHVRVLAEAVIDLLDEVGRGRKFAVELQVGALEKLDAVRAERDKALTEVTDAPRKLMCVVELTVEDAVMAALEARARVAELEARIKEFQDGISEYSSEAARYKAECDALAGTPDPRVVKLEIELAMMKSAEARPLLGAAAAWAEAKKALALADAAATACEDALDVAKGDVEAKRRSDNASLWYITCRRDEEKAAQAMRNAAERLAARAQFASASAAESSPPAVPLAAYLECADAARAYAKRGIRGDGATGIPDEYETDLRDAFSAGAAWRARRCDVDGGDDIPRLRELARRLWAVDGPGGGLLSTSERIELAELVLKMTSGDGGAS